MEGCWGFLGKVGAQETYVRHVPKWAAEINGSLMVRKGVLGC